MKFNVNSLQHDARERARSRIPIPFDGEVKDETIQGIRVRRYTSRWRVRSGPELYFLHGGYGVFGDLSLQDNYCRLLSSTTHRHVTSIDYPLAPEHTLTQSASAAIAVLQHDKPAAPIVCGDSAGGAVALAMSCLPEVHTYPMGGLLLTNPNVDLTLGLIDNEANAGPDIDLLRNAMGEWTRTLRPIPQFQSAASNLPATFIAVGSKDALVPEATALVDACRRATIPCELVIVKDAAHGFISDTSKAQDVIHRAESFFGLAIEKGR